MPDEIGIEQVQEVIDELEGVVEKRIKAKTKLEIEMEVLDDLGHTTIKSSGDAIDKIDVKIDKRNTALQEEFDNFMSDYEEIFECIQ